MPYSCGKPAVFPSFLVIDFTEYRECFPLDEIIDDYHRGVRGLIVFIVKSEIVRCFIAGDEICYDVLVFFQIFLVVEVERRMHRYVFRAVVHVVFDSSETLVGQNAFVFVFIIVIIEIERGIEHLFLRVEEVVVQCVSVVPSLEPASFLALLGADIPGTIGKFESFCIATTHFQNQAWCEPTGIEEI